MNHLRGLDIIQESQELGAGAVATAILELALGPFRWGSTPSLRQAEDPLHLLLNVARGEEEHPRKRPRLEAPQRRSANEDVTPSGHLAAVPTPGKYYTPWSDGS
jgi:hypothetical protein